VNSFFASEPSESKGGKFAVSWKCRSGKSNKLDKMEGIKHIAQCMPEGYVVDLNNPDITVLVNVIGRFTGIGLIRDYKRLSEFNVRTLIERHEKKSDAP